MREELRSEIRRQRRQLGRDEQREAAARLAKRVAATPFFRTARRVAGYFAVGGEIDPWPLLERARERRKSVYLPVLASFGVNRLWFAPYRPGDALVANRFGIPEPVVDPKQRLDALALDVVLVPLVAFDDSGTRLGMGGGFYDRTFHYLTRHTRWSRPRLLGLAYEFQRVDELPRQWWDVPLYGVATERELYLMGHSRYPEYD